MKTGSKNINNIIILITSKGSFDPFFNKSIFDFCTRIGLQHDLLLKKINNCIAIIDKGKCIYCKYSDKVDTIGCRCHIGMSKAFMISSCEQNKSSARILIDNLHFCRNFPGLNLTIINKNEAQIIDSIAFVNHKNDIILEHLNISPYRLNKSNNNLPIFIDNEFESIINKIQTYDYGSLILDTSIGLWLNDPIEAIVTAVRNKGIFDGKTYLKRYPDVMQARLDPIEHYIKYGIHENRVMPVINSTEIINDVDIYEDTKIITKSSDKLIDEKIPHINEDKDLITSLHNNTEFIKIRILATLLRDYGIKHIVLSPGGRDVPLVRIFEYNESIFALHRITDERSAAYFGLGIARQIQAPVACICTSGTAASNYLPAVTEAYFTGIPLILVTADRMDIYHGHGEDQTIPQKEIYHGVVKKSISIPEDSGYRAEYQTRRDISECILETTNGVCGPVHINFPIDNISIGENAPRKAWNLLPKIYPHILRVTFNDPEDYILRWVNDLKKQNRILLIYGQNTPLSSEDSLKLENFVKKFNCVVLTDTISNIDCSFSLQVFNALSQLSQVRFNEELTPEIIITVGGKRLMNDPLTYKIRGGSKGIRHWQVSPDGKIKDFYFRLTSIIHMSQDKFFEFFSRHAGDINNNEEYYKKWLSVISMYKEPKSDLFNIWYIQSKFFSSIPPNSLLHLGVGQSFYHCRCFKLDSSIDVFCNMGTNGIDGSTSTFLGQCSVVKGKLCFLIVGDLSFFYDMNSIWNKDLNPTIRILMINNNGTGLLWQHKLKAIQSIHNTTAKGWVESVGFKYISASNKEEFDNNLPYFLGVDADAPIFFEVFVNK